MTQYATDTHVTNGHLESDNVPFSDNIEVRVYIVPKVKLPKMSFKKIRTLTKSIKSNLSENVNKERDEKGVKNDKCNS